MIVKKSVINVCVIFLICLCIIPFGIVLYRSLIGEDGGFSLKAYYDVFLAEPVYLIRFWKSLAMCVVIMAGQMIVSVMAGYGFAKFEFPGKNILFVILMILMVMPVQVTLVPNYMLFDKIGILNTWASLILPGIFSPFGTFITMQNFRSIPNDILDAAKMDGCSLMQIILKIIVPIGRGGIISACILTFLDNWNMVEQPIAYLKDFMSYPLSVALATTSPSKSSVQMACCLLVLLPPLFMFLYFNHDLVEGIVIGEEK